MAAVKKRGTWGGRRPGAGAKPKPPGEARHEGVFVRLTPAEREALEAAAEGSPLATWIREAALRAARRARR